MSPYSPFVAIPTTTNYSCDQAGTTQGRFLGCNSGTGGRAGHGAAAWELWQSLGPLPGYTVLAQASSKAAPGSFCCCMAHHSPFPIHPLLQEGTGPYQVLWEGRCMGRQPDAAELLLSHEPATR